MSTGETPDRARTRRPRTGGRMLLAIALGATACGERADLAIPSRFGEGADLFARMLAAEDARGRGPEGEAPLFEALRSGDPELRRLAVRGLGRLEQPVLADSIRRLLDDAVEAVRAEAVNALGQAVSSGDASPVRALLEARLAQEPSPRVRGVIAETLGRLRHGDAAAFAATASRLAGLMPGGAGPDLEGRGSDEAATDALRIGLARGFYFLGRQPARGPWPDPALAVLRSLVTGRPAEDRIVERRIRTVASAALAASPDVTPEDLESILADADPFVRREAVPAIARIGDPGVAQHLVIVALADTSAVVRYEALRVYARVRDDETLCRPILEAVRGRDPHIALLSIDLLADGCAGIDGQRLLDSLAGTLPRRLGRTAAGWHVAAHALVSPAASDSVVARVLRSFVRSRNPFVRAYAARAATRLQDTTTLARMAEDADDNVRAAAVRGLHEVADHGADDVYIAQLRGREDSDLIQAAAQALEGSPHGEALSALFAALERASAARRETWRDARLALVERIAELGNAGAADRLRPWLTDHDPAVAGRAAEAIAAWTGERPAPSPRPLAALAPPTPARLETLDRTAVTIEMADGGIIELRLRPFEAPTNAHRFARLARDGFYDGLTFHRVAPNFVIQGGSPGANEYAGDGPYTRDELGLVGNWRGSVGLSTRGRDTGDAQFYVNLIDNIRLDHNYTVFAEVVNGMDVVDRVLEGAVMRRITVTTVK